MSNEAFARVRIDALLAVPFVFLSNAEPCYAATCS
jgi:hypothetical protein